MQMRRPESVQILSQVYTNFFNNALRGPLSGVVYGVTFLQLQAVLMVVRGMA